MDFVRTFLRGTSTRDATASEPAPSSIADATTIPTAVALPVEAVQATVVGTDAEPEKQEPVEKMVDNTTKLLDLVFLMDCTGSMGSYIQAGKDNIQKIADKLAEQENCDVRFAVVAYRDHPPQDSTFVTKLYDFTNHKPRMQSYLDSLSASGGGDGPEAVTAGLYKAENLAWRQNATKIVILIADAPPHGLGESGDGFPNGDPDGLDPLAIANSMAKKGIVIYPVACEPALSQYQNARAFMVSLAEITQGYATSLSNSSLLADIILGGTAEEVGLQSLAQQYQADIAQIEERVNRRRADEGKVGEAPEEEVAAELYSHMRSKNLQTKTWHCDGKISDERARYFKGKTSLAEARKEIVEKEGGVKTDVLGEASGRSLGRRLSGSSHGFAPPSYGARPFGAPAAATSPPASATVSSVAMEDVSMEQTLRIYSKSKR